MQSPCEIKTIQSLSCQDNQRQNKDDLKSTFPPTVCLNKEYKHMDNRKNEIKTKVPPDDGKTRTLRVARDDSLLPLTT